MSLAANKCSIFSKEFFMTKQEEREEARRLRRQGMSINKIAKKLGISLSSASTWCRDIPLTEEQEEALRFSNERYEAQAKGAKANVEIHREKRRLYQAEGRQKAREGDALHLAGCMLYWAEGAKSRHELLFVNSDADMLVIFIKFLRESMNIPDEKLKLRINCYLNNGLTQYEIEQYWLDILAVPREQLRQTIINDQPKSSQQKGRKLRYGVCVIAVSNVRFIQHIYGAIQEYSGIDKPEWLDC
jgi:hypothetical protein